MILSKDYQLYRSNIISYHQENVKEDQSGQALLEFIFLLVIIIFLSMGLLAGFNGLIGKRWTAMVHVITKPSTTAVSLQ